MKPLQSGSIAVYNAIEECYSLEGHSPGIRVIMKMTGFKSTSTIEYHLGRLEQAGWIIREPKKHYAIVPIHEPRIYYIRRDPVVGRLHAASRNRLSNAIQTSNTDSLADE